MLNGPNWGSARASMGVPARCAHWRQRYHCCQDVRTTAGSRVLADYISLEDAMVVEQLRKAGAIIIGKTNTHGFLWNLYAADARRVGYDTHSWRFQWRLCRGHRRGMCLGAIGSDTGGSNSHSAACCGIMVSSPHMVESVALA